MVVTGLVVADTHNIEKWLELGLSGPLGCCARKGAGFAHWALGIGMCHSGVYCLRGECVTQVSTACAVNLSLSCLLPAR